MLTLGSLFFNGIGDFYFIKMHVLINHWFRNCLLFYNFFPHTPALPRPLSHTTGKGFALLYVVAMPATVQVKPSSVQVNRPECTSKVAAV